MNKAAQTSSPNKRWISLSSGEYITVPDYASGMKGREDDLLFVYIPLSDSPLRRGCKELADVLTAVAVSSGDERVTKHYSTCLTMLGDHYINCFGGAKNSVFWEKADAIARRNAASLKPESLFIKEVGLSHAHRY